MSSIQVMKKGIEVGHGGIPVLKRQGQADI